MFFRGHNIRLYQAEKAQDGMALQARIAASSSLAPVVRKITSD